MHYSSTTILILFLASCGGQTANDTESNNAASRKTQGEEPPDCDSLSEEAADAFNETLDTVTQCAVDADCEPFPMPEVCWAHCTETLAGSEEFQTSIAGVVSEAIGDACGQFDTQGCGLAPVSCPVQGRVTGFECQEGYCIAQRELP